MTLVEQLARRVVPRLWDPDYLAQPWRALLPPGQLERERAAAIAQAQAHLDALAAIQPTRASGAPQGSAAAV